MGLPVFFPGVFFLRDMQSQRKPAAPLRRCSQQCRPPKRLAWKAGKREKGVMIFVVVCSGFWRVLGRIWRIFQDFAWF